MPFGFRFSLLHLLLATALVGILISLYLTGRYYRHSHNITWLSFAPDGKRLAVIRTDIFWGHAPYEVGRTISILRLPDLMLHQIVEQRTRSDDVGMERTSIQYNSVAFDRAGRLYWPKFEGDRLMRYQDGDAAPHEVGPTLPRELWGVKGNPDTFALHYDDRTLIWRPETGEAVREIPNGIPHSYYDGERPTALSRDSLRLLTKRASSASLETMTPQGTITQIPASDFGDYDFEFLPADGRFVIAGLHGVRLYDAGGAELGQLSTIATRAVCISPVGDTLAIVPVDEVPVDEGDIQILETRQELSLDRRVRFVLPGTSGSSVAFSSDGRWLATGGEQGKVLLWDAHTGQCLGVTTAPGYSRGFWTWPAALLVGWGAVSGWLYWRGFLGTARDADSPPPLAEGSGH